MSQALIVHCVGASTINIQLTGAAHCHMDDMFSIREWSLGHRIASLPYCGHTASSSSSRWAADFFRRGQEMNLNFVVAALLKAP